MMGKRIIQWAVGLLAGAVAVACIATYAAVYHVVQARAMALVNALEVVALAVGAVLAVLALVGIAYASAHVYRVVSTTRAQNIATIRAASFAPGTAGNGIITHAPLWDGKEFHVTPPTVAPPGTQLRSFHVKTANAGDVAPVVQAAGLEQMPTFSLLLAARRVGGDALLLGRNTDDGEYLYENIRERDPASIAIAGMTRSGKTTTALFQSAQFALMGARFAISDPHAKGPKDSLAAALDPLRPLFVCPPVGRSDTRTETARNVYALVAHVRDMMDRRLTGKESAATLLVLAMDELAASCTDDLALRADDPTWTAPRLADLVASIAREGAKAGVFVLCTSQGWTAKDLGSAALRDAIPNLFVHRLPQRQAAMFAGIGSYDRVADGLPPGRAVLVRQGTLPCLVDIPATGADDLAALGERLAAVHRAAAITGRVLPSGIATSVGNVSTPADSRCPIVAPSLRIVEIESAETSATALEMPERRTATLTPLHGTCTAIGEPMELVAAIYRMTRLETPPYARTRTIRELAALFPGDGWPATGTGRGYRAAADRIDAILAAIDDGTVPEPAVVAYLERVAASVAG